MTRKNLRSLLPALVLTSLAMGFVDAVSAAGNMFRAVQSENPQALLAPALRLEDAEGREYDLAELKGKVILVNFWATWCPACRRELPSLDRLGQQLGGESFQVLTVNVGEDAERIASFLDTLGHSESLPILLDPDREAAQAWRVRGLPASWIVDTEQRLALTVVGEVDFESPELLEQLQALMSSHR